MLGDKRHHRTFRCLRLRSCLKRTLNNNHRTEVGQYIESHQQYNAMEHHSEILKERAMEHHSEIVTLRERAMEHHSEMLKERAMEHHSEILKEMAMEHHSECLWEQGTETLKLGRS